MNEEINPEKELYGAEKGYRRYTGPTTGDDEAYEVVPFETIQDLDMPNGLRVEDDPWTGSYVLLNGTNTILAYFDDKSITIPKSVAENKEDTNRALDAARATIYNIYERDILERRMFRI